VKEQISIDARVTESNMSVELGAKFGVFEADGKVIEYVRARSQREFRPVKSDTRASYDKIYIVNCSDIEPQIAFPHEVGNVINASETGEIAIDQAVIASCTNAGFEDLDIAAAVLNGRKVHSGVRLYVSPATWDVYRNALNKGIIGKIIDAGGIVCSPSCGFCTGYLGQLAAGEKCIASTPRNFRGRNGSVDAEVYLASPATVAASAIRGKIADPREVM